MNLLVLFNYCLLPFNLLCAESKYNIHAISKVNIIYNGIDCLTVYSKCVCMGEGAKFYTCYETENHYVVILLHHLAEF